METARRPWMRWIALGIAMATLSRGFEAMGDAAPFVDDGIATERFAFHGIALLLLVGAVLCGYKLVRSLIGRWRDGADAGAGLVPTGRTDRAVAPQDFDPDAAFARYMERKAAGEVEPVALAAPVQPRAGFGRKGT